MFFTESNPRRLSEPIFSLAPRFEPASSPSSRLCSPAKLRDSRHGAACAQNWNQFVQADFFLVPENGTYRPRPRERLGRNPELARPPILRARVDPPETANLREK